MGWSFFILGVIMGKTKRTLRERKFIKAYIENGGNATKAYMDVKPDYKGKNARVLGHKWLTKVNISDDEIMEELGLTDTYLYEKIREGTEATKVVSVIPVKPKEAQENNPDLPDATSKNVEFIDVEDYPTRHKYLDMMLKLKNKYPAEKHEHEIKVPDVVEVVHYIQEGKPPEIIEESDANADDRKEK